MYACARGIFPLSPARYRTHGTTTLHCDRIVYTQRVARMRSPTKSPPPPSLSIDDNTATPRPAGTPRVMLTSVSTPPPVPRPSVITGITVTTEQDNRERERETEKIKKKTAYYYNTLVALLVRIRTHRVYGVRGHYARSFFFFFLLSSVDSIFYVYSRQVL